jgi:hypothetical protein
MAKQSLKGDGCRLRIASRMELATLSFHSCAWLSQFQHLLRLGLRRILAANDLQ